MAPPVPGSFVTRSSPSGDEGHGLADLGGVGDGAQRGVLEVGARSVDAALEHVAGGGGDAEALPVVERPSELVDDRADEERRVGEATAQHEGRSPVECFDDRLGADVGVSGDDLGLQLADGRTELGQREVAFERLLEHVVAPDHADPHALEVLGPQRVDDVAKTSVRIGRAEVPDDAAAVGEHRARHGDDGGDAPVLARRRVHGTAHLGEGEGALSQAVVREVVDRSAGGERRRRLEPVLRISRATADRDARGHQNDRTNEAGPRPWTASPVSRSAGCGPLHGSGAGCRRPVQRARMPASTISAKTSATCTELWRPLGSNQWWAQPHMPRIPKPAIRVSRSLRNTPCLDPAADHAEEELIELVALGLDGGEAVAGQVAALLEEDPDVVAVELHAPHELTEQLPQLLGGVRGRGKRPAQGDELVVDELVVDEPEQVLLALEVVVERALRHAGPRRDLIERGARETLLAEQVEGAGEDGGTGSNRVVPAPRRRLLGGPTRALAISSH